MFCSNRKFRMISPLSLLLLLLLLLMLNGVSSICNYYQNMQPEQTYYLYNPRYPGAYQGENHCTWQLRSSYKIKLNCNINMPSSYDCLGDRVGILYDGKYMNNYCGQGRFITEGMNATVTLNTKNDTLGGVFLCEAITVADDYNCQCGWKNPTRVVGGEETGVNEYPMMAGIVDSEERLLFCGATIISQKYVVTAAHCLDSRDIRELGIVVGEHDVTTGKETDATKLFRISNCFKHPLYKDYHNDIAVCKIKGTIQYSSKVGPVCLPFHHYRNSFDGSKVTALGWGLLQFGGAKATKLQKVNLNVINQTACKTVYNDADNTNMCTYSPGKDTCQMDSGGPVLWQDFVTRKLVLAGITSSGFACASKLPAIDTRVGAFLDWIISVTPDVQYCKAE
ncbi:hypothetical protein HN011_009426 [Eciton burchellii]|nr:hypothetical protein HN011_009426 [Eciton burchellii]